MTAFFFFSSVKNLKSKEERRLRRKAHKQSFQDKQVIKDEILQKKQDSASSAQKGTTAHAHTACLNVCLFRSVDIFSSVNFKYVSHQLTVRGAIRVGKQ